MTSTLNKPLIKQQAKGAAPQLFEEGEERQADMVLFL
jgi:hypothetical protein